MIKLFPLWENTAKSGNTYLQSKLNKNTKILILKNNYKQKDTDPDYHLYIDTINNVNNSSDKDITEDDDIPF